MSAVAAALAVTTAGAPLMGMSHGGKKVKDSKGVMLYNATQIMGLDVITKDGEKAGDIVDLVFRLGGESSLSHAIVMTGGFIDLGGDARAVPIEAVDLKENSAKLNVSMDEFRDAPILGRDATWIFRSSSRLDDLDKTFSVSSSRPRSEDRDTEYVMFSDLKRDKAIGADGDELGRVTDAWVNLNDNRFQYIEIDLRYRRSYVDPYVGTSGMRYAIPISEYRQTDASGRHFGVTAAELRDAPAVRDSEYAEVKWTDHLGKAVKIEAASMDR